MSSFWDPKPKLFFVFLPYLALPATRNPPASVLFPLGSGQEEGLENDARQALNTERARYLDGLPCDQAPQELSNAGLPVQVLGESHPLVLKHGQEERLHGVVAAGIARPFKESPKPVMEPDEILLVGRIGRHILLLVLEGRRR